MPRPHRCVAPPVQISRLQERSKRDRLVERNDDGRLEPERQSLSRSFVVHERLPELRVSRSVALEEAGALI